MTLKDLEEDNEVFKEFKDMIEKANLEDLDMIVLKMARSADLSLDELDQLQKLIDDRTKAFQEGNVNTVINKNNINVNTIVVAKKPIFMSRDKTMYMEEGDGATVVEVLNDGVRISRPSDNKTMKFTWDQLNEYLTTDEMLLKEKPGEEFELSIEDKKVLQASIDSSKLTDSDFDTIQKNAESKDQEALEDDLYNNNPCEQ
jgi:hypothetical protein